MTTMIIRIFLCVAASCSVIPPSMLSSSLPEDLEGVLSVIQTPPNLVSSVNLISVLFTPDPVALVGV